jgi:hypothetical protein
MSAIIAILVFVVVSLGGCVVLYLAGSVRENGGPDPISQSPQVKLCEK